jgi:small GTP-binding protein
MGQVYSFLWGNIETRVLILGLDNSGKTTILYNLHLGEVIATSPTVGFNLETIEHSNVNIKLWDISGQLRLRQYWKCYYTNTRIVIFVIDSNDTERLEDAKNELVKLFKEYELHTASFMIIANKQDLPNALSASVIQTKFEEVLPKDREWTIFPVSAIKSKSLDPCINWIVQKSRPNIKRSWLYDNV